jgi:hypothetical protein
MTIILNTKQKKLFKQNQDVLLNLHEDSAPYLQNLKNTAIIPSKIGNIATWKIYQINNVENFAHIFSENYTKVLNQEDIVQNCYGIEPLFIDENYVVNKINVLKEKLKLYPVEPVVFRIIKNPREYFSVIICKKNSPDKRILSLKFFATHSENIISLIESELENRGNTNNSEYAKMLEEIKSITSTIEEKKQLEENMLNNIKQTYNKTKI